MKKLTTLLVMAAVIGSFLVVGCGKGDNQTQAKADANAVMAAAQKDGAAAQKDAAKKAEEAKKSASDLLGK